MVPGEFLSKNFSFHFPLFKLGMLIRHMIPTVISAMIHAKSVPEFNADTIGSYDLTLAYGWGIEGIRERAQWPDNAVNFYPLTKQDSKYNLDDLK